MVYVSSRETRPSREVSERGEEANRPQNLQYDALRAMASGTRKVERGDGRSRLRKEPIGKSRFHNEAISKGKEKLDTIQREVRQFRMEDELQFHMEYKEQLQMKDKEQLQASAGGSRSEHDDLISEHFREANASMDKAAWLRNTDPTQNSNQRQERLKDAGNALKLANEANECEQQKLAQRRSEQQRLEQQQLPDSRRQEQKKQYRYLVLD